MSRSTSKTDAHDKRPEVAELAREVCNLHFPHAERNAMKKQHTIHTLTFELYMEVYDGSDAMDC